MVFSSLSKIKVEKCEEPISEMEEGSFEVTKPAPKDQGRKSAMSITMHKGVKVLPNTYSPFPHSTFSDEEDPATP